ncbi:hypothetical protein CQA81_31960, partial [Klebsiella pneumoniae]
QTIQPFAPHQRMLSQALNGNAGLAGWNLVMLAPLPDHSAIRPASADVKPGAERQRGAGGLESGDAGA